MNTFDFAGSSIAYARTGQGAPIVFLHNGGTSHAIWRRTAALLGDRYESFALDLLGYGASSAPDTDCTLDTHVAALSAFLDAEGLPEVSLVGNCMGSAIALRFAMQRPSAVRGLVLINPLTEATLLAGGFGAALRLWRLAPRAGALVSRQLERVRVPRWAASGLLALQVGRRELVDDADADELCACYANRAQMASLLAVLDDLTSYRELDRFRPGPAFPPLCTIWGGANRVLSPRAGRELNARLRPTRAAWLADCGHLPMVEQPAAVADAIRGFLSEVAA